jgi:hypothetical protein
MEAKFIKFKDQYININYISYIEKTEDGTARINFKNQDYVYTDEPYECVIEKLIY